MLTFEEYLREMKFYSNEVNELAISKAGEYDFGKYSWFHLSTGYLSFAAFKKYKLFKIKNIEDNGIFGIGMHIDIPLFVLFKVVKDPERSGIDRVQPISILEYEKVGSFCVVRGVHTNKSIRKQGFGKILYSTIIQYFKIKLLGDEEQYIGARKLWGAMSESKYINVEIYDIEKDKISKFEIKDIEDPRIWAPERNLRTPEEQYIAENIRLLATFKTNNPNFVEIDYKPVVD